MRFIRPYGLKPLATAFLLAIICFIFSSVDSYVSAGTTGDEQANTIRVSISGSNTGDCGSEAAPCQTIQYAVQQRASSGDTILVAAGTYTYDQGNDICQENLGTTGAVCVVNKEVTLRGGYTVDNWSSQDNANETIIDGSGSQRGVLVIKTDAATSLTMDGFIIQNGLAKSISTREGLDAISAFGGGMFVDSADKVSLNNVIFKNNRSIGDDTSESAGGAGSGGGLALRGVEATLTNLTFEGNEAIGGSGSDRGGFGIGGGIHTNANVSGGSLTFSNNIARGGNTTGEGRDGSGFQGDALGGGATFHDNSIIELDGLTVQNNQAFGGNATTISGGAFGGGVFVEKATATLANLELRGNKATGGTAVTGWLGRGGGAEFIDSVVILTNVKAIENQAVGGAGTTGDMGSAGGGGLSATSFQTEYPSKFTLTNGVIAGNRIGMGAGANNIGGGGGGLLIQAIEANLAHLTIANNLLDSGGMLAPGIIIMNVDSQGRGANATISDSIMADHAGTPPSIHVQSLSEVTFDKILVSNDVRTIEGTGTATGSDTMVEGDASFVDAANFDYHIMPGSAAIDKATGSTVALDIDDKNRLGFPDLGAYESDTPTALSVTEEPDLGNQVYLPLITQ